ncbi:TetR family transcriptional regulator [Conexibacter sp. JD483]|uniref:TetR family transcriptional regulator n=1 Tax=unclassified Conexibacter TaxID=2627773 RepID=UPI00271683E8|nr:MULTISPECIES: TetR family transcriptional regulator [unclassified Conexibacter]MDO8189085.1 TetR family transcriptional regulator [Conexibacter sp. CPCC 205706]MDO8201868.1 TetR family transcriptional regulator [Conexibacter sp. CPCC 205762]MDR9372519.1 TetR family transcriptional regulator [Conexibacter sp. JD483]
MARWEPDSRGRLAQAALELYAERGFERTTVAEIAARAGVTERTFFRHFADKREVLFSGSEEIEQALADGVAQAPAGAAPLDAVAAALTAIGTVLQSRRPFARTRQQVIAATPELQERELRKLARLGALLGAGLRERGVAEPDATVAAETGIALFRVAFERWSEQHAGAEPELTDEIATAFARLRVVAATPADGSPADAPPAAGASAIRRRR